MVIYLLTFWPFEDPIFTKIEVMNELTSILLLYHLFTFTDWIPDASKRYMMGWSFIVIMACNLGVHFFILSRNSFGDI